MTSIPSTLYAQRGDSYIAYQVLGKGPPDIIFVRGSWNHVELQWEEPMLARFLTRLSSIGRLVIFDPLGLGLSDPFPGGEIPLYEDWSDDLLVVLDAVGSRDAVVVCSALGTFRGVMFVAAHPERVRSLVLIDGFAKYIRTDDYPFGHTAEEEALASEVAFDMWGKTVPAAVRVAHPELAAWVPRYQRYSAGKGFARRLSQAAAPAADVRSVLPLIQAPTLVVQHDDPPNPMTGPGPGRFLANHIEGASYVELPGRTLLDWRYPDPDAVARVIERFVLGREMPSEPDRVLATILFTDIVDSTRSAVESGDRRWTETLDALDGIVNQEVAQARGRVIKSTGDGHLAIFDGPGRAIRCAMSLRQRSLDLGLRTRAGLHTGEVEMRGFDIGGVAVSIARRVCDIASDDGVFVSASVPPLVAGSGIEFVDRGPHELKGVPDPWALYEVVV